MTEQLNILIISGSIRRPSHTLCLTKVIEEKLVKRGIKTMPWDLAEKPLPIADPTFHDNPLSHSNDTVKEFVKKAQLCDGFVLASPIYHNSYSGVLKNALDNISTEQFQYKPAGLLSHGGNRSTQAVDHLRIVVRSVLGIAIPAQVCTSSKDYTQTNTGYELVAEDILQRADRFASELGLFAEKFRDIRREALKKL